MLKERQKHFIADRQNTFGSIELSAWTKCNHFEEKNSKSFIQKFFQLQKKKPFLRMGILKYIKFS